MTWTIRNLLLFWLLLPGLFYSAESFCQEAGKSAELIEPNLQQQQKSSGLLDLNVYWDSRGSYDYTLNGFAQLNKKISYFTFTNYYSGKNGIDFASFYSEHHLYWKSHFLEPVDYSVQVMSLSGMGNDALRFGFRYRLMDAAFLKKHNQKLGLVYNIAFHVVQIDANKGRSPWLTQIEHFYRLSLFGQKVYLSGFIDQNVGSQLNDPFSFVTEHQLGISIYRNFYFVTEYRYNDGIYNRSGLALGFEYLVKL